MERVIVIGDSDTVLGFMLAGVKDAKVATNENADGLVNTVLTDPQAGILIITQETVKMLSTKTHKLMQLSTKPVVIEVPAKRDVSQPGQSINEMVKKAIGVELK